MNKGLYAGIALCDPRMFVAHWPNESLDLPMHMPQFLKDGKGELCSAVLIVPHPLYSSPPPILEECQFGVENLFCHYDPNSEIVFMERKFYHEKCFNLQNYKEFERNLDGIDASFAKWKFGAEGACLEDLVE
jgi:hypothetical protein